MHDHAILNSPNSRPARKEDSGYATSVMSNKQIKTTL